MILHMYTLGQPGMDASSAQLGSGVDRSVDRVFHSTSLTVWKTELRFGGIADRWCVWSEDDVKQRGVLEA